MHVIFTLQILSFVVYNNKATCVSDLLSKSSSVTLFLPTRQCDLQFFHTSSSICCFLSQCVAPRLLAYTFPEQEAVGSFGAGGFSK